MPLLPRIILIWVLFVFLVPVPLSGSFGPPQSSITSARLTSSPIQTYAQLTANKKSSRTQRSKKSTASSIHNLRFHKYADHTRLVIDLKGALNYSERKDRKHNNVVFELDETRLSKRAYRTTLKKGFPESVHVAREWNKPVTITINLSTLKKYKFFTLKNPNRLVIDLFPGPFSPKKDTLALPKVVKKPSTRQKTTTPKVAKKAKAKRKMTVPQVVKKVPKKAKKPAPTVAKKSPVKAKVLQPITLAKPTPVGGKLLIVLDPGHGGKDPGALGRKGTREKDIVLKVSKQLKTMIQERLKAKVLMTREKDVFIELEDRAEFANSKKADLFVSIHVNSHPKKSVKGLELYHFGEASDPRALEVAARENGTPLKDNGPAWQFILADKLTDKKIENSRDLAWIARKALVEQLRKHYKIKDHGVKTAPFFVLRMTTMPGILAEIAFVSNPTEEKLLTSKTYQKRVAEGIFKGVKAYVTPLQTVSR